MIIWISYDDQLMIIWWSTDDHLLVIWLSSDDQLMIILKTWEGSEYHKKFICIWLSYDHLMIYHSNILRRSSNVHVMIIWISYDEQEVTCLNCNYLQIDICTNIYWWSSEDHLIIIWWSSAEHVRRDWL